MVAWPAKLWPKKIVCRKCGAAEENEGFSDGSYGGKFFGFKLVSLFNWDNTSPGIWHRCFLCRPCAMALEDIVGDFIGHSIENRRFRDSSLVNK